jgi:GNAT superfamily N-acetyltransferase
VRAQERHLDTLARILSDWVAETPWMPKLHSRSDDRKFLGRMFETEELFVDRAEAPRGFLALDGEEISALYVDAPHRGQGVGFVLLGEVQALRDRLSLWTFQANTGAQRFYRRAGFVEVERTDGAGNEERLPDVRMEWQREVL